MSKNIIFFNGIPRAGNTLLGSIVNSNKNIKATPNSVVLDILFQLAEIKKNSVFENFPDHESFDNVATNVFDFYYKDWDCNTILERGPWGTPLNLELLNSFIDKPKFFILTRPLLECLASFVKLKIENKSLKQHEVKEYVENQLMQNIFKKWIWGVKNIVKSKQDYLHLDYNQLINSPKIFLKKLSQFCNVEITLPSYIKQFKINDVEYNDRAIGLKNLHRLNNNKIKKNHYKIENYLSLEIIDKYKNFNYFDNEF
jgi:hypothetical protein|tara:strand:- start:1294 stop:2061 length:768 start_codon:yes stop_codon:yes gene_type:complete